MRSKSKQG